MRPEIESLIQAIALEMKLPADLLRAQVQVESSGRADAFRYEPAFYTRYIVDNPETPQREHPKAVAQKFGPLAACSFGLLQILLETAYELGFCGHPEELFDPRTGLWWGALKMKALWLSLGTGKPENYDLALAAYNGGSDGNTARPLRNQAYVDRVRAVVGGTGVSG